MLLGSPIRLGLLLGEQLLHVAVAVGQVGVVLFLHHCRVQVDVLELVLVFLKVELCLQLGSAFVGRGAVDVALDLFLQEILVLQEHLQTQIIEVNCILEGLLNLDHGALDLLVLHQHLRLDVLHFLLVRLNHVQLLVRVAFLNFVEYFENASVFVL